MADPKRRIFIGDIQGCRVELERLLEATRFDPAADRLHPVGDLVNRGPDSHGALRLLCDLDARAVLGNHDLHLLQVHAGLRATRSGDTLDALLRADDAGELCAWLARQPFLRTFDDLYLVHAGLHPAWTDPEAELGGRDPLVPDAKAVFAVRVRECDAGGAAPEPGDRVSKPGDRASSPGDRASSPGDRASSPGDGAPAPRYKPWFEHYDPAAHGGRMVVYGHWAMMGLVVRPHLRGLDTGCVWGNRLTAWIAEEDRLVDVPAARAYARIR